MANQELSEILFQSVEQIVDAKLDKATAGGDIIAGTIIKKLKEHLYKVQCNGYTVEAVSEFEKKYDIGDLVYVYAPDEKKTGEKLILGKFINSNGNELLKDLNPLSQMTNNLTADLKTTININTAINTAVSKTESINLPSGILKNSLNRFCIDVSYNVAEEFQSLTTGEYGVKVFFFSNGIPIGDKEGYNFSCLDEKFYSFPYTVYPELSFKKVFNIEKVPTHLINEIRVEFYCQNDFSIQGLITLEKCKIVFGEDINRYIGKPISLYLDYQDKSVYGMESIYSPTIHALIVDQQSYIAKEALSANQQIKWYEYVAGHPGDEYGGFNWKLIENEDNNLLLDQFVFDQNKLTTEIKAIWCEALPNDQTWQIIGESEPLVFKNALADHISAISGNTIAIIGKTQLPIYNANETLSYTESDNYKYTIKLLEDIEITSISWSVSENGLITGFWDEETQDYITSKTYSGDNLPTEITILPDDDYYADRAINTENIITCTINNIYTASIRIDFSLASSQGTNYIFKIVPKDTPYLTNAIGSTQTLAASLTMSDGTVLPIDNKKLSWSWYQYDTFTYSQPEDDVDLSVVEEEQPYISIPEEVTQEVTLTLQKTFDTMFAPMEIEERTIEISVAGDEIVSNGLAETETNNENISETVEDEEDDGLAMAEGETEIPPEDSSQETEDDEEEEPADDSTVSSAITNIIAVEQKCNTHILQAKYLVDAVYKTEKQEEITRTIELIAFYPIKIVGPTLNTTNLQVGGIFELNWNNEGELTSFSKETYEDSDGVIGREPYTLSSALDAVWSVETAENTGYYTIISRASPATEGLIEYYLQLPQGYGYVSEKAAIVARDADNNLLYQQPLMLTMNNFSIDMTNKWAGGVVTIDEEAATIMATAMGAGHKNVDNSFTGVLMGDIQLNAQTGIDSGLFGFNNGQMVFKLNKDAEFFVGSDKDNYISFKDNSFDLKTQTLQLNALANDFIIDSTGSSKAQYIYNEKETVTDEQGNPVEKIVEKSVDFDNAVIAANNNFIVTADGKVFAKNVYGFEMAEGVQIASKGIQGLEGLEDGILKAGNRTFDLGEFLLEDEAQTTIENITVQVLETNVKETVDAALGKLNIDDTVNQAVKKELDDFKADIEDGVSQDILDQVGVLEAQFNEKFDTVNTTITQQKDEILDAAKGELNTAVGTLSADIDQFKGDLEGQIKEVDDGIGSKIMTHLEKINIDENTAKTLKEATDALDSFDETITDWNGTIKQWETDIDKIKETTEKIQSEAIHFENNALNLGENLIVSKDNEGTLIAKQGIVGSWHLGEKCLYAPWGENDTKPVAFMSASPASNSNLDTEDLDDSDADKWHLWFGKEYEDKGVKKLTGNFGVNKKGRLFAKDGHFEGTIVATDGSFTGTVQAASGYIAGWNLNKINEKPVLAAVQGEQVTAFMAGDGIQNDTYKVQINNDQIASPWRLWFGDTSGKGKFGVDNSGKLYAHEATIIGNITAEEGNIGGWTISKENGYDGGLFKRITATENGKNYTYQAGIKTLANQITDDAFYVVKKDNSNGEYETIFKVRYDGTAIVSGEIRASAGYIGGWDIGTTSDKIGFLQYKNKDNKVTALMTADGLSLDDVVGTSINGTVGNSTANQPWRLWFGNSSGNGQFGVTDEGKLYANGAFISGTIHASEGVIGCWNINNKEDNSYQTGIYNSCEINNVKYQVGMKTFLNETDTLANQAFYVIKKPGTNSEELLFGVSHQGSLTATMGKIANIRIGGVRINNNPTTGTNTSESVMYSLYDDDVTKIAFYLSGTPGLREFNISNELIQNSANPAGTSQRSARLMFADQNRQVNFLIDNDGKLYAKDVALAGYISAKGGFIGGWTIDENKIYSNSGNTTVAVITGGTNYDTVAVGDSGSKAWRLWFGNSSGQGKFGVTTDGVMYCYGAKVGGDITADSGDIGGWKIKKVGDEKITSYNTGIYKRMYGVETDENGDIIQTYRYQAGLKTPIENSDIGTGNSAFYVIRYPLGVNGTKEDALKDFTNTTGYESIFSVNYRGEITATKGVIGGWTIGEVTDKNSNKAPALYTSDDGKYIALITGKKGLFKSIIVNDTDLDKNWRLWFADDTGTGKFGVATDGTMFATNANIAGKIRASSGRIGGWTIASNMLWSSDSYSASKNKTYSVAMRSGEEAMAFIVYSKTGDYQTQAPSIGRGWNYEFYVSKEGVLYADQGQIKNQFIHNYNTNVTWPTTGMNRNYIKKVTSITDLGGQHSINFAPIGGATAGKIQGLSISDSTEYTRRTSATSTSYETKTATAKLLLGRLIPTVDNNSALNAHWTSVEPGYFIGIVPDSNSKHFYPLDIRNNGGARITISNYGSDTNTVGGFVQVSDAISQNSYVALGTGDPSTTSMMVKIKDWGCFFGNETSDTAKIIVNSSDNLHIENMGGNVYLTTSASNANVKLTATNQIIFESDNIRLNLGQGDAHSIYFSNSTSVKTSLYLNTSNNLCFQDRSGNKVSINTVITKLNSLLKAAGKTEITFNEP